MNDTTPESRPPDAIARLIRMARVRLASGRFIAGLHDCLVVALVVVLGLVLAEKALPEFTLDWMTVLVVLGTTVLAGAWLMSLRSRPSDAVIAAMIDERLELRDRISTALHCSGRDDPFARAAVAEALETAGNPEVRNRLARAFTPQSPGGAWVAPVVGLLALLIWTVVPAGDLFAGDPATDRRAVDEERDSVEDTMRTVLDQIEENDALAEQLGDVTNNFALDESRPDASMDPEEQRREALRKVSELERRLDEIVNGEQGKRMEAMERALSEMETETGDARELSEAMKQGDFSKAREALEQLQKKMDDGAMTEEQKEALAESLDRMSEELKKAAENKDALEEALRRAGLDPALAENQQALEQAMEQAGDLNQQQIEQLQQMMNAQNASAQSCENMGEAMSQMAQQARQGQSGASQQQMEQMLSDAEQLQQMLMQAQNAKNQCQGGGSGGSMGSPQEMANLLPSKPQPGQSGSNRVGTGFGGTPGSGGIGDAPLQETKFSTRLQKEQVALQEGGDVISRQLVESSNPVVGQSTVEIQATAERIIQSWEEGARDEVVPAHRREGVKGYLGELTRRLSAQRRSDPAADSEVTSPRGTSSGDPAEEGGSAGDAPKAAEDAPESE